MAAVVAKSTSMEVSGDSQQSGTVSGDCKKGNTVPTFERGRKEDADKFQPFSLTSLPGKMMEVTLLEATARAQGGDWRQPVQILAHPRAHPASPAWWLSTVG